MWRAFFLGIGIYLVIFGIECLAVDRVVLRAREDLPPAAAGSTDAPKVGKNKEFVPAPWVPWSLMSSGVVVCLYSFTIPKRMGK